MSKSVTAPVTITGLGCVSAVGGSCSQALAGLKDQKVNNTLVSKVFPGDFSAPCFLVEQTNADLLSALNLPNNNVVEAANQLNRTILLALKAIKEGLQAAKLTSEDLSKVRVGVALGTTVGCTFHNEDYYVRWKTDEIVDHQPLQKYFVSNLADRIQKLLGVRGPKVVVTNACASGTDAIGIAKSWLQHDMCDVAIAGGADEISRIACHGFKSLMLVSEKSCTPFDVNRCGLNLGEGAGVVIMESDTHVISRSARAIGTIRGYGIAGDGHHPTAPHPEGRGLQRAVRLALEDAGLSATDICMINAHGTGTKANDMAETKAISSSGFNVSMPVVSTKGATGHTLGAAGGIEAVFTLLALNSGELNGTIGCHELDPNFSFAPLLQGSKKNLDGPIGMSQSLAFGGGNSALILEGCCS